MTPSRCLAHLWLSFASGLFGLAAFYPALVGPAVLGSALAGFAFFSPSYDDLDLSGSAPAGPASSVQPSATSGLPGLGHENIGPL